MRVLIAGCGYVGLALSRHLAKESWSVWGLRRSESARDELKAAGAVPLIANLANRQTLSGLPVVDYVVSCQAPGKGGRDYRSTYLEGARNLIEAIRSKAPKKFLWVSSTSVYGQSNDEWVNEETMPEPASENAGILLEAESVVLNSPFPSLVLRLGGIYGPGRERFQLLQNGTVSVHDPGYLNHIHVDDVVRLIRFLLECGAPGEVYLGVDDEPVLRSGFYRWLADRAGIEPAGARAPDRMRSVTSKRCSNQKIKSLGFVFKYPTYREGFSNLMPQAKR